MKKVTLPFSSLFAVCSLVLFVMSCLGCWEYAQASSFASPTIIPNMQSNAMPFGSDNVKGYNVVLLFDASASMSTTDSLDMARNAAGLLLDSLYTEEDIRGEMKEMRSAAAIVRYDDSVKVVQDLEEINSSAKIDAIKRNKLYKYDGPSPKTGDTGLGEALLTSVNMLRGSGDGRKKMIVLMTDGFDADSSSAYGVRSVSDSQISENPGGTFSPFQFPQFANAGTPLQNSVEQALRDAQTIGCEVYVLGLGYNDSHLSEFWAQFRTLANAAQSRGSLPISGMINDSGLFSPESDDISPGRVNYFYAHSLTEAQTFYVSLVAAMAQNNEAQDPPQDDSGDWRHYNIEVTPTTSCMTLYVFSERGIQHVTLEKPDGSSVILDVGQKGISGDKRYQVRWGANNCYSTVTYKNPEPGSWHLGSQGENVTFDARYVLVDGVTLSMDAKKTGDHSGVVTIYATYGDEPLTEALFRQMGVSCTVQSVTMPRLSVNFNGVPDASMTQMNGTTDAFPNMPSISPEITVPLTYDNGVMRGEFAVTSAYQNAVKATVGGHTKTETLNYPLVIVNPAALSGIHGRQVSIPVSSIQNEWDNVTLNVTRIGPGGEHSDEDLTRLAEITFVTNARTGENEIVIQGLRIGSMPVKLYANDNQQGDIVLDGTLRIRSGLPIWLLVFLALILTGLCGALIYMLIQRVRSGGWTLARNGRVSKGTQLRFDVDCGYYDRNLGRQITLSNEIRLPYKNRVTLYDMLNELIRTTPDGRTGKDSVSRRIAASQKALKSNQYAYLFTANQNGVQNQKAPHAGERITINAGANELKVKVRYTNV